MWRIPTEDFLTLSLSLTLSSLSPLLSPLLPLLSSPCSRLAFLCLMFLFSVANHFSQSYYA